MSSRGGCGQRGRASPCSAEPDTDLQLGVPAERVEHGGQRALLAVHAMEGALRGRPSAEVRDLAERALDRGALLDDETADGPVYYLPAFALSIAEDLQTAEAALTAAVGGRARRAPRCSASPTPRTCARSRSCSAGAFRTRSRTRARPWRWSATAGGSAWAAHASVLANCLIERGDFRAARRHLAAAEMGLGEQAPALNAFFLARGRLAFLEGDPEAALEDFRRCGELGAGAGADNPAFSPWRSNAAIACAVLGRHDEAEELAAARARARGGVRRPRPDRPGPARDRPRSAARRTASRRSRPRSRSSRPRRPPSSGRARSSSSARRCAVPDAAATPASRCA